MSSPNVGCHQRARERNRRRNRAGCLGCARRTRSSRTRTRPRASSARSSAADRLASQQRQPRDRRAAQPLPQAALPFEQHLDAEVRHREQQELDRPCRRTSARSRCRRRSDRPVTASSRTVYGIVIATRPQRLGRTRPLLVVDTAGPSVSICAAPLLRGRHVDATRSAAACRPMVSLPPCAPPNISWLTASITCCVRMPRTIAELRGCATDRRASRARASRRRRRTRGPAAVAEALRDDDADRRLAAAHRVARLDRRSTVVTFRFLSSAAPATIAFEIALPSWSTIATAIRAGSPFSPAPEKIDAEERRDRDRHDEADDHRRGGR